MEEKKLIGKISFFEFARFYWSLLRMVLSEKVFSAKEKVEKFMAVFFTILLALNKPLGEHVKATWEGISPWWAAVPVGLLILWSFLRANYERFEKERIAKETAEANEQALVNSKQLRQEWEKLEEKFSKGYSPDILAGWSRQLSSPHLNWFLLGGRDERMRNRLSIVMEESGHLLLTSQYARGHFTNLEDETNNEFRWLNFVREIVPGAKQVTGTGSEHGIEVRESGEIKELTKVCADTCALLAAKEKWPAG